MISNTLDRNTILYSVDDEADGADRAAAADTELDRTCAGKGGGSYLCFKLSAALLQPSIPELV